MFHAAGKCWRMNANRLTSIGRLLFRLAPFFLQLRARIDRARHGKPRKFPITRVAQKIVAKKYLRYQWRRPIAASDSAAAASWTSLRNHCVYKTIRITSRKVKLQNLTRRFPAFAAVRSRHLYASRLARVRRFEHYHVRDRKELRGKGFLPEHNRRQKRLARPARPNRPP